MIYIAPKSTNNSGHIKALNEARMGHARLQHKNMHWWLSRNKP